MSGIGGCPFSPNRVGNVATEKVLQISQSSQVNFSEFKKTKEWLSQQLK
jgi:butyrate kinase